MKKFIILTVFLALSLFFIAGCIGNEDGNSNTSSIKTIDIQAEKLLSDTENNFSDDELEIAKQVDDSIDSLSFVNVGVVISSSDNESDNITQANIENKAEAYHFYGIIFGLNNYTSLSLYCFLKAYLLDTTNSLYLSEIAAILIAQGREKDAKAFINLAEKMGISEPTANITFATYYELIGDKEKALTLYNKAVNLNPNDPILRQFFFDALADYNGFSEELLKLRKDTMQYCATILNDAFSVGSSIQEIKDYDAARSKELTDILSKISAISTSYTKEHLTNIYTIWEDLLFDFFNEWNSDEDKILNNFTEATQNANNNLNQCAIDCAGDSGCVCGCINAYINEITEYATTNLYPEIYSVINKRIPNSFDKLNSFEIETLSYIMKNIQHDDIDSILNLTKFLYYNYQNSCIDIGMNYVTTVYPYEGVYGVIYSMGNISCPPTEYPKAEEKATKTAKDKLDENNNKSNDIEDLFDNMKFKVCIGGDLLGGCATYNKGVLGLEFSSAGISMSGRRDLKTGRGLGGSIGLKYSKDAIKVLGVEMGTTIDFDSSGNFKGISVDSEIKAINGKKSLGKFNLFVYNKNTHF